MTEGIIQSTFPILVFITGAAIESMIILFQYDTNSIEVGLVWIIALASLIFGFRFLYLK